MGANYHVAQSRPMETYAIFSANYPPNVGGVEKYTQNLARTLASQGDRAIVVTNNVFGLEELEQECAVSQHAEGALSPSPQEPGA